MNVSDFNSIGCWQSESDNAGGERAWTNDIGAKKYATIECSRVWVYGTRNLSQNAFLKTMKQVIKEERSTFGAR